MLFKRHWLHMALLALVLLAASCVQDTAEPTPLPVTPTVAVEATTRPTETVAPTETPTVAEPTATPTPTHTPPVREQRVEGLQGILHSSPDDTQNDGLFQPLDDPEVRYPIEAMGVEVREQVVALYGQEHEMVVRVWGSLVGRPEDAGPEDTGYEKLLVTRLEVVEPLVERAEGWQGQLVNLPPGHQLGSLFRHQDGREFSYHATTDDLRTELAGYLRSGATIRIWGEVNPSNDHITIERVEAVSG